MSDLSVVILAAGQGTRMKSHLTKVLHEICGRPLLEYSLLAAEALKPSHLAVVIGRDAGKVEERFQGRATFVLQEEQNGTGHAVLTAKAALTESAGDSQGEVLILYGDTPLLLPETLQQLSAFKRETGAGLAMLTAPVPLPGRIVRAADGQVVKIVEQTDATPEELEIQEGNTGVYLVDADLLWDTLAKVDSSNEQGEIYLTDIVELAVAAGRRVEALKLDSEEESLGVNTRVELAEAAQVIRRRTLHRLMSEGVTVVDPDSTYIDAAVEIGRDSVIWPGCVVTGESVLGERVILKPYCVVESSRLGNDVELGPMAHLRPDCQLEDKVKIGNFVEVKNSHLAQGVKAAHLSYIGDADVGPGSSFGCGSITVNYDWEKKHRTTVGSDVNIGCNSNLLAPISIEDGSAVAAGSTLTDDVPEESLAVARAPQRNLKGWMKRRRKKK